jgi:uncharacterized membrane protein
MTFRLSSSLGLLLAPGFALAAPVEMTFTQLNYLYYPEAVSNGAKLVVGNTYHPYAFGLGGNGGGDLPGYLDSAYGVSADGATVVGRAHAHPSVVGLGAKYWPVEWEGHYGEATAISANGNVVAGSVGAQPGSYWGGNEGTKAFRWVGDQVEFLPSLPGTTKQRVTAASATGDVLVGYNDDKPVKWTFEDGVAEVEALDIEGNVKQVLAGDWAFLYQPGGLQTLKDMLVALTSDPTELASLMKYKFTTASVSPDGLAITGWAAKSGHPRGYLAVFSESPFGLNPGGGDSGGGGAGPVPTPEPSVLATAVLVGLVGLWRRGVKARRSAH